MPLNAEERYRQQMYEIQQQVKMKQKSSYLQEPFAMCQPRNK